MFDQIPAHTTREPHWQFALAQVPVTARLSFLVPVLGMAAWASAGAPFKTAVLLTWIAGLTFVTVASAWLLAWLLRRSGGDARVDLAYLGGLIWLPADSASTTVRQSTWAHLASIAVGVGFGAVAFGIRSLTTGSLAHTIASELVWVAVAQTAAMLLPMPTLIGGRLVGSAAWALFPHQMHRIAAVVALLGLTGWLVVGTLLGCWPMLIFGMLVAWVGADDLRGFYRDVHDERLSGLRKQFREADDADDKARIESLGLRLVRELASDEHRAFVIGRLAHLYYEAGRLTEADALIDTIPEGYAADPVLRGAVLVGLGRDAEAVPHFRHAFEARARDEQIRGHLISALTRSGQHDEALELAYAGAEDGPGRIRLEAALFYAGRFSDALDLSEQLWNQTHAPDRAYNAACSACRLGSYDRALVWLERAIADGFDNLTHLESDSDLAALADRPELAVLKQRIRSKQPAS